MEPPGRLVHPAIFAIAVALGAIPGDEGQARPAPPIPPLHVDFAGCASVLSPLRGVVVTGEPICELPRNNALRLWADVPPTARLTVSIDARPHTAPWSPLEGGQVVDLALPADAHRLIVALPDEGRTFTLALAQREDVPALDEAEAARKAGKLDDAEARATALLQDPRASVRARASGMLARIARRKAPSTAIVSFRDAMSRDREAGRISDFVKDGLVLAMTLIERDASAAAAVLDSLRPAEGSYPEGRAMSLHYRSLLSFDVGDLRAALRGLTASALLSERLALDLHRVDVLQKQAEIWTWLGRPMEAWRSLAESRALLFSRSDASSCAKAQLLNNMGWFSVRAAQSMEGAALDLPDPTPLLQDALALFRGVCPDPAEAALVLLNLAIAALDRGDAVQARTFLDESRRASATPGPYRESIRAHLEARLSLAGGQPELALRRYEAIAAESTLPDARLIAVAGMARAEDALGHVEAARRAYAEADAQLDRWSLVAPFGEGRQTFATHHLASTRARIDFLLRQAERAAEPRPWLDEAVGAARRGRARALEGLRLTDRIGGLPPDALARWRRSLEHYRHRRAALEEKVTQSRLLPTSSLAVARGEIAAEQAALTADFESAIAQIAGVDAAPASLERPMRGELLLVYHSLDHGWVGFAVDHTTTLAHRMPAPDPTAPPERAAEHLVAPFDALLATSERIRFAPSAPLRHERLRALPWRGKPLLTSFPIVEGLDIARPLRPAEVISGASLAVVVADPRGDLPAARREADAITEALGRRGIRVLRIDGQRATFGAVRDALEGRGASLFHYSGHGVFLGRDGWESGLLLAADTVLRVPDVLALARVPPTIVLSGCETARTDERAPLEGLGVAQAFVLAGATSVAAATRAVEDRVAERIMTALYDMASDTFVNDLSAGLRRAELGVSGGAPARWSSFQVIAP